MMASDPPPSPIPPGQTFRVSGRVLDAAEPEFAEGIAQAYAERRRPRCLCRPGGIEMYIARLSQGYVVKRMPDTSSQHTPDCASYELPAELSGLSRVLGSAIVENPVSGETSLRVDFPLSRRPGQEHFPRSGSVAKITSARAARLSLRGLLHYLWDQAELTHWRPSFEGKRTWGAVRRCLLRAAEQKTAGGCSLPARMYVPEVFSVDQLQQINARRQQKWAAASSHVGRSQPMLLVIAELKAIQPAGQSYRAVLKHVPDIGFLIDDSLYHAVGRSFGKELGMWAASDHIRMVIAATFCLTSTGVPRIGRLCLMPVTEQWLPVETTAEQQLVDRLVKGHRRFRRFLRYDLTRSERLASVALTDQGDPAPILFADDVVALTEVGDLRAQ
ncbi:DUF1173 family protein [Roseateles sp. NT4]|uniref:DUF1173 family protein n=1 Tax=Roseateles sp. NT4 TaxID=3453715 RepID=UPI003EEF04A0